MFSEGASCLIAFNKTWEDRKTEQFLKEQEDVDTTFWE